MGVPGVEHKQQPSSPGKVSLGRAPDGWYPQADEVFYGIEHERGQAPARAGRSGYARRLATGPQRAPHGEEGSP
jgi:hypothetical protein